MNIIPQMSMFGDNESEELGDLERLQKILSSLPDEGLIRALYRIRGQGRNDWPCEAMWNTFVASFLFEHPTIEALLRELRRNKQLRDVCGIKPKTRIQPDGTIKVYTAPSESAYSKFLNNLMACKSELKAMFENLVQYMYEHLEGFGEDLMVDGKAIQSFSTRLSDKPESDHRGEHDADWCKKTYTVSGKDGEKKTKEVKWFGFRLHLIADANYELPVDFEVTKASNSEKTETKKQLNRMKQEHARLELYHQGFLGQIVLY